MSTRSRAPEGERPSLPPVQVLSVPPNLPVVVRFLGPVLGLNTHWRSGRSFPCPGPADCPASVHRLPIIWKGYSAVQVWESVKKLWRAYVLEVTESLEEQLRHRDLRGETWTVFRKQRNGKNDPCQGVYCERVPEAKLSPCFDITPVLLRLFHCSELVLGTANPMPPRLVVEPVAGDAPQLPAEMLDTSPPADDPQKMAEAKELWKQMRDQLRRGGFTAKEETTTDPERNGRTPSNNGQ